MKGQSASNSQTHANLSELSGEDMSIYRINKSKENPYVIMNKDFLKRPDLSMQSKGLLAYLLSLPDDWKIKRDELPKHFQNGIGAISATLQELIKTGYIRRSQERDKERRFSDMIYDIFETPAPTGKDDSIPQSAFRETEAVSRLSSHGKGSAY